MTLTSGGGLGRVKGRISKIDNYDLRGPLSRVTGSSPKLKISVFRTR